jgi:AbrB family looped-hinge helix DNA binding protein
MAVVAVSPKGQILIPKCVREKYGVKAGGKVQIIERAEGIVLKAAPDDPIDAACGWLSGDFSLTRDLLEERRKERER